MNNAFRTSRILRWLALLVWIAIISTVPCSASMQNPVPPARSSPAARSQIGNKVEPLSNRLMLTMSPEAIIKMFGPPHSDERVWGGGLGYNDFNVILNATDDAIWDLVIYKNVKLNSGIGIGDSKDQVQRVFPGGSWTGENYAVSYDQYYLNFFFANAKLVEIQISPVLDRFSPYKK